MAQPQLLTVISSLNEKITKLVEAQNALQAKILRLEEENMDLKAKHSADMSALKKAQTDIEFLTVSHKLASSDEALISTRRHIARLIRTIDNCISMINED